jgi:hypothetical protein
MSGEDPILPDDFEPNNSVSGAYNLGTVNSRTLNGLTIHQQGAVLDQDFFRFVAPANGIARVAASYAGNPGSRVFRILNAAQSTVANVNLNGAAGDTQLTFDVTAGQTYYIRFSGTLTTDYSLQLSNVNLNAGFD